MKERKSYKGTLNGVFAIWTDQHPEDAVIQETVTFYTPDEGYIFVKDGEFYDCVVIQDGETIDMYVEIVDPRPTEEKGEENE